MQHVIRLDDGRTPTYLSVLDNRGELQVAISDMRIVDRLGPNRLRPLEPMLRQAALLVLDTNLGESALAWLIDTLSGKPLFVDTVSGAKAARIEPHLHAVHTLTPSLMEAEALSGIAANSRRQLPAIASWLHDRGVHRVFITMGRRGVFYSTGDKQGLVPPGIVTESKNTGGAGDAFLAGLAYAQLKRWPLDETLRFSLAVAGITLGHAGTGSPSLSLAAVERQLGGSHVT